MFQIQSQTITEDLKASTVPVLEWKFQIANGNTGETKISDPLLDTEARAEERAKSEFLKSSYRLKEITFATYRTDLTKNMIINVLGIPYLVKSLTTTITQISIKTNIRAIRYEQ